METGRVEILRPAGQASWNTGQIPFLATKKNLSTNQNIHIYFIMNKVFS